MRAFHMALTIFILVIGRCSEFIRNFPVGHEAASSPVWAFQGKRESRSCHQPACRPGRSRVVKALVADWDWVVIRGEVSESEIWLKVHSLPQEALFWWEIQNVGGCVTASKYSGWEEYYVSDDSAGDKRWFWKQPSLELFSCTTYVSRNTSVSCENILEFKDISTWSLQLNRCHFLAQGTQKHGVLQSLANQMILSPVPVAHLLPWF